MTIIVADRYMTLDSVKPDKDCNQGCDIHNDYTCFGCEDIQIRKVYPNAIYNEDCEWEIEETMLKETMNTQDKIVINLSSFKYYNQLGGFYACKLPKGTKHIKSNCPRDLRIKLEKLGYEVNTDK